MNMREEPKATEEVDYEFEDDLKIFLAQYIQTALWSTNDESDESGGEPMDFHYGSEDLHPATLAKMTEDCRKFLSENRADIGDRVSDAGHDFFLTRNHHGCGFWETPDWPEEPGQRLTNTSHSFGEVNLYVGDDGKIYL